MADAWRIAIDRGGTFTDVVAWDPEGCVHVRKVPTGSAGDDHDAAIEAVRDMVGAPTDRPIASGLVATVRYGTTTATNALLTLTGEPCALFVTRGFGDLLEIGTQARPDIFALDVRRPSPLATRVVEVDERVLADGAVRTSLDESAFRAAARAVHAEGLRSAAVLFLHSYAFPAHEVLADRLLRQVGFDHVALSHLVAPRIKAVERGDTAVADAYLTPVLRRSMKRFRAAFAPDVDVRFMQSHGGLADAAHAAGPRALLSGPAGGVVAVAQISRETGEDSVIGFDMGGTSTDVCRFAGELPHRSELRIAGRTLRVPCLDVVTVAAGGGSVLLFDGRRFRVGSESAGSDPGPAGYGRGGPATLTDANAVLGRLWADTFPHCFGHDRTSPFCPDASREAVSVLADAAGLSVEEAAAGFVDVAGERMAQAIREVTILRGHDVRASALVCFGGAAAQHACAMAQALGMRRVIVPLLGSVLSAWGIGVATVSHEETATLLLEWGKDAWETATRVAAGLSRRATEVLAQQGVVDPAISPVLEMRVVGTDATIDVPLGPGPESVSNEFERAHHRLYGVPHAGRPVQLVAVRALACERRTTPAPQPASPGMDRVLESDVAQSVTTCWFRNADGLEPMSTPVFALESLDVGAAVHGPALLVDAVTTVVVEPGWDAVRAAGNRVMLHARTPSPRRAGKTVRDPVSLALFANRFMSVAERMGSVLERLSHSTNIKERLDFSCAVFDGAGRLVANAPHIPVHLGAVGGSVRAILRARGTDFRDGDTFLTNDPYHGGSHLPDVTAVSPVLVRDGVPRFFVANRAHHADVGGISPGSMPPLSKTIDEEGVRFHDILLGRGASVRGDDIREIFERGPYPARNPRERVDDLIAQMGANAEGVRLLRELARTEGEDVVAAYMGHVLDDGEEAMRELIARLPRGIHRFEDALDDGTPLVVSVRVEEHRVVVDFEGTGPRSAGNLNTPAAVVRAAVLYSLRTLVSRAVPLNEGCLRPVEIRIPPGSLLDPVPPAAVVGGNVETSMRLVDVTLGALGACAAGPGTMNNLTFGITGPDGPAGAYYETIAGGTGAGPGFRGASGVQAHMTNTRITDVEIVETRWPVVVRRFAVRRGSGGSGRHRGGDGLVRAFEFLAPAVVSILSERRRTAPFGLAGGGAGASGINVVVRGGEETVLPGCASVELAPGDVLRIETPGGGGYSLPNTPP